MGYSDFFVQRPETQKIVDAHRYDFTYDTVDEYLKKAGGYKAYIKSLGGVFAKYADFKGAVKTKAELYDVMDYVWGLYNIWGVDYSNGCSYDDWTDNRYKARDGAKSAFYPRKAPLARFDVNYGCPGFANGDDLPGIDEMLESKKYYAVTNCGQGVAQALKKAGLIPRSMPDPAYYPARYAANGYGYTLIKNAKDLMPGDVLLYTQGGTIANRSTRKTLDNWTPHIKHTNIVGKRDEKYIYMFDSGHAFTDYGECVNRRKIGQWPYEWAEDWIGIRLDCIAALKGEDMKDGWNKVGGNWYYYKDKKPVTGWQKLKWSKGEDWFCFSKAGIMLTGWQELGWDGGKKKNWFYFNPETGAMITGFRYLKWSGGWDWFLFDKETGAMKTGNVKMEITFDKSGRMTGGKQA